MTPPGRRTPERSRPGCLVVVTGTGTGVGKTWWTAALATELAGRGHAVAARKPVQSFDPSDPDTDADILAAATGAATEAVCPPHRRLATPMAPPMAIDALGLDPFTIADLAAELTWPEDTEVGFVEGVGGPRSPLATDGDTTDLVAALEPDAVVLVADAGLGTLNAVRLCADVLAPRPVVALNRFDPTDDLHRRNRAWLAKLDVVVDPIELAARLIP